MQGVFPLLSLPFEQHNLKGFRTDAATILMAGLDLVAGLWAGALPEALAVHHLPEVVLGEKYAPCGVWGFLWQGGVDRRGETFPPVQAGIVLPKAQGF